MFMGLLQNVDCDCELSSLQPHYALFIAYPLDFSTRL